MKNAFKSININSRKLIGRFAAMVIAMAAAAPAWALPLSHYAQNSVLAEGRWVRVKVETTGMHIISKADLQRLGFSDISKVNVYGTGGRQVGKGLTVDTPDDLPLLPSVKTDKGIVFFAVDRFSWSTGLRNGRPYEHSIHAYSDDSYYFISDIDRAEYSRTSATTSAGGNGKQLTEYTARLVHEKELEPAGDSGSQVYGEDFRTLRSQTFSFKMPGRVSGTEGSLSVRFAAKTTNGASNITVKANGTALPSSTADRIAGVAATYYGATTESIKTFSTPGETLDGGI